VIAAHGRRVELAVGIGDQLRADRSQLADVRADRVEHSGDRVVADLDAQRTKLALDEVGAFGGLGDLGAGMDLGAELLQLVGQRLGAPSAGVHDDEHGARRQIGGSGRDQGNGVLASLRGRFQHHHAFVGEQRRAQQFGELAGAHLPRAHAIDRDVVGAGLLASRPQDRGDRALDKQLFVPEHQV
jgi:hypothetical protein